MQSNSMNTDELLLDDLLGRLEPEGRRVLQQRLTAEPQMRQRAEHLQRVLSALDAWSIQPPSPALADRIIERIAASGVRPIRPSAPVQSSEKEVSGRQPILTLKELMAVAACITLLVGITVPSVSASRERARQAMCRENFAAMGGAMRRYTADYAGAMPNVGIPSDAYCIPVPGANVRVQPNLSNLLPLLRAGYVANVRVLFCPSDGLAKPFGAVDWQKVDQFPTPPSYSLQHISASTSRLPERPDMIDMGDSNPLLADQSRTQTPSFDKVNSLTHHGKGQNVLRRDGSARWQTSPTVGPGGDNIWVPGNLTRPRGNEIPVGPTDVLLKP